MRGVAKSARRITPTGREGSARLRGEGGVSRRGFSLFEAGNLDIHGELAFGGAAVSALDRRHVGKIASRRHLYIVGVDDPVVGGIEAAPSVAEHIHLNPCVA